MRIRILSYTKRGRDTAAETAASLRTDGHICRTFALPKFAGPDDVIAGSAGDWAAEGFREDDALIFVCAAGIAVRAVAPCIKDKTKDPAVIVMDEAGRYVIPLLSGHIGGGNALAEEIARLTGAAAVLTTATDVNGVFAVDVFAKKNRLRISDRELAKAVSAALLAGEKVGFRSDVPVSGVLPDGLTEGEADLGIYIGRRQASLPYPRTLILTPQRYTAGIGCRRGKSAKELSAFLLKQLTALGIGAEELSAVSSIDLKKDETGILELASELGVPFLTFTAKELAAVPGTFSGSAFVLSKTGVDSVCERAAVRAFGGRLIAGKSASDGMTCAIAVSEEEISFG
ncbi:MAG: cobalt-precorrin 5A hydrolase [Lachnospiraceae bacterium]|nr:cobalt-precorrin 5A hydrolase [Lachnospiraceae bacterium]